MSAIQKYDPAAEQAIRTALQTSLYPGASDSSVSMVLAYCQAAGLDPMQKPVHIVPMWDSKARTMRDVVMPGIGLYRTNAARTGEFAGITEPEFGPMVTERIGNRDCTFPEWCRVTVSRRLPSGHVAKFTAVEYWIENYAIKGGKDQDQSPNAMWTKRPRGQLAKCAQAQALRMAFPEAVGSAPTAEEMEGKQIEGQAVDVSSGADLMPKAKAAPAIEHETAAEAVEGEVVERDQQQSSGLSELTEGQRKVVLANAARAGLNEAELLQRFPSITPATITATLKSLREIAERAEA